MVKSKEEWHDIWVKDKLSSTEEFTSFSRNRPDLIPIPMQSSGSDPIEYEKEDFIVWSNFEFRKCTL